MYPTSSKTFAVEGGLEPPRSS